MNNKFVTHSNGKITRVDLTDGLVFHKQNALPTSINLPEQSGQYVLNCDGSRGYSFELKEEQATIQLIPSQFMNADNTCAFTGYPSIPIANSANDWKELKLNNNYFQIIRCADGVYDTVNLNSTVFASVAGFNKQNCSTNVILYVDGADTKTDNKVKGITLPSTGPYILNNNLSNSSIDPMYVNGQNLFKNCLGVNSNNKGFITYEGNSVSKVNLPSAAGYHVLMRDTSGNFSFSTITLDRVVAIADDNGIKVADEVNGASVSAKVLKNGKEKKVIVYKMKPKKGYRKKQGHRQPYTKVQIEKISM